MFILDLKFYFQYLNITTGIATRKKKVTMSLMTMLISDIINVIVTSKKAIL